MNRDKWKNVINRPDVVALRNHILNSFKDVEFIEKTHQYFLHGKELKSVSKVVEQFVHHFDSNSHAQRCFDKYYDSPDSKYYRMTKEDILSEWKKTNKKACDMGHEKHSYNEELFDYYTGKINDIQIPSKDDFMKWNSIKFWDDLPQSYIPLLSECRVYEEKLGYSGTFDLLCAWDRGQRLSQNLVLLDYKTNIDLFKNFNDQRLLSPFDHLQDSPFNHYILQLSLYQIPLENIGCKIIDRIIVYLNESTDKYGKYKLDNYINHIKKVL
jgi:hypothetical protein